MKPKKRFLIFGIFLILLIKIISITALGSGASLGGIIDIPMGNQTFPNMTLPSEDVDNEDITTDDDVNDSGIIKNQTDEIEDNNTNATNVLNNSNSAVTTNTNANNYHNTPGSSSSVNSNKDNKISITEIIKSFIGNPEEDKIKEEPSSNQENPSPVSAGFDNQNDFKIILVVNTLCLFFAFVTLRNYDKSLEKK